MADASHGGGNRRAPPVPGTTRSRPLGGRRRVRRLRILLVNCQWVPPSPMIGSPGRPRVRAASADTIASGPGPPGRRNAQSRSDTVARAGGLPVPLRLQLQTSSCGRPGARPPARPPAGRLDSEAQAQKCGPPCTHPGSESGPGPGLGRLSDYHLLQFCCQWPGVSFLRVRLEPPGPAEWQGASAAALLPLWRHEWQAAATLVPATIMMLRVQCQPQ